MPSNGDGAEQSNDEATRQDSPPARSDSQPAAANTDMSSADGVRSNGGFYRPSLSAETTSTTAGNLDSAIEHMRQALNEVGKEETSNEDACFGNWYHHKIRSLMSGGKNTDTSTVLHSSPTRMVALVAVESAV